MAETVADKNKLDFDGGIKKVFEEQWLVDVWIKAGDQTDAIPAHKLILGARSKVFKNMLELDDHKASSNETITLSEMTHDELETLLKFMYSGDLLEKEWTQHVRALYLAGEKYEIPYLQDLCRKRLIDSMDPSNMFDVLQLAQIHSDENLQDAVYEFIDTLMEGISLPSNSCGLLLSKRYGAHMNKVKNEGSASQTQNKLFECHCAWCGL